MYITEERLNYLKFNKNSKFFNSSYEDIFFHEFKNQKVLSFLEFASCLFHKLVDVENNIWLIKFPDDSFFLLKIIGESQYAKAFPSFEKDDVNRFFHDIPR